MSIVRNPVGWFEIYVSDMGRARGFYESVLGVSMEELPTPDDSVEMVAFPMNAGEECGGEAPGACGALAKMEGMSGGSGGTLVYFSCGDCATEESRVQGAGGQVVKAKFGIGEHGFISLVMDTEGNMIGLHSMS